jgi:hypothetical protein|tara:strand:+ start:232 stop:369 length:138 start_codon:yes stop_codon:yes gene_type:complete
MNKKIIEVKLKNKSGKNGPVVRERGIKIIKTLKKFNKLLLILITI